MFAVVKFERNI
uniref:Uncharacterized protein n=1 Tax=Arundo donax TaxID=35708 RepID=A0A0A8YNZ2_ARUDO